MKWEEYNQVPSSETCSLLKESARWGKMIYETVFEQDSDGKRFVRGDVHWYTVEAINPITSPTWIGCL